MQVDPTLVTDLLIDLFFMLDIILNFNTGFISDQVSPMHVWHLPCNAQPTMTKASALTIAHHERASQLHQPSLSVQGHAQHAVFCARDWSWGARQ